MTGASHRQLLVPQRSLTSSVKRLLSLTLFIPSKIVRNHSFVVFVLVFLANLGLRHNKPVKWLNAGLHMTLTCSECMECQQIEDRNGPHCRKIQKQEWREASYWLEQQKFLPIDSFLHSLG